MGYFETTSSNTEKLYRKLYRKTNIKLKLLCSEYSKCSVLDLSGIERHMFTRHGMHLNDRGKVWLGNKIVTTINELVSHQKVIPLSSK